MDKGLNVCVEVGSVIFMLACISIVSVFASLCVWAGLRKGKGHCGEKYWNKKSG